MFLQTKADDREKGIISKPQTQFKAKGEPKKKERKEEVKQVPYECEFSLLSPPILEHPFKNQISRTLPNVNTEMPLSGHDPILLPDTPITQVFTMQS